MVSPTHQHGHVFDLVLSCCLPVSNIDLCLASFSDHMPVLFEICLSRNPKLKVITRHCRTISPVTAELFSDAFTSIDGDYSVSSCGLNTDDLTSLFYSTCQNILDTVALVRTVQPKPKVQPRLKDVTRAVRTECRRAERRWKKDRLQISLNIFKDNLDKYQKTVRSEKSKYLLNMIFNNSHEPRVLFSTINAVLNTPSLYV